MNLYRLLVDLEAISFPRPDDKRLGLIRRAQDLEVSTAISTGPHLYTTGEDGQSGSPFHYKR